MSTAAHPTSEPRPEVAEIASEEGRTPLTHARGPLPDLGDVAPVPFPRLVHVELRKMVDTLAGRAMLAAMAIVVLVVVVAYALWGPDGEQAFGDFLGLAQMPLLVLLPIVGIMAATQEWSQRTGLATFTLEPRRGRVVAAKLIASLVLGLVVTAAGFLAAAIGTLIVGGSWTLTGVSASGLIIALLIFVLQGVGFGLVFLSTPLAIVATLVLPTAWTIIGTMFSSFESAARWLDLNQAVEPLSAGTMTGQTWAHLGTASLVWVVLPILIGTARVLRREVK